MPAPAATRRLCILLLLLRPRPLKITRKHQTRAREPFIKTFVELVPVHKELEPLLGRLRLLLFDLLAGGVWVHWPVADGEDLSETFLGLAIRVLAADEDLAAY